MAYGERRRSISISPVVELRCDILAIFWTGSSSGPRLTTLLSIDVFTIILMLLGPNASDIIYLRFSMHQGAENSL